ncbi:MAG TPA: hypothetical protein VNS58_08400 [Puia sp.]|nr:hypothetical protein [Puia sp.]
MKSETEVRARINVLTGTIETIRKKRDEELRKPMSERDHRILVFLSRETTICEFTLAQLQWLLSN